MFQYLCIITNYSGSTIINKFEVIDSSAAHAFSQVERYLEISKQKNMGLGNQILIFDAVEFAKLNRHNIKPLVSGEIVYHNGISIIKYSNSNLTNLVEKEF